MATKKARQRISYVLENNRSSAGGHRLGVLGIAVDTDNSILYSGGRDGAVCAWDLNFNHGPDGTNGASHDTAAAAPSAPKPATTFRAQTQAHMHWINDIILAQNNTALVSASSDLTVKVWRPHSEEHAEAQTIGAHADYANRLAAPPSDMGLNWVASGGLDRKVCLWDLNGGGKTLEIDVAGEDKPEKGSVYALAVGRNVLAVGSPEKTLRLYDHRTGDRVSKLVGHVDNIRSILIDDAGDTILTASGDKTIKMWSVKGGRCMYTFTMHDEPVWSLHSNDPRLGVFYSSDRSGLVAKTDVRGSLEEMDDGLSVAVAKEHSSVWKVTAAAGSIWTATGQSSINRWDDINMDDHVRLRDNFQRRRGASVTSSRTRQSSVTSPDEPVTSLNPSSSKKKEIPPSAILRVSNTSAMPLRTEHDSQPAAPDAASAKTPDIVLERPESEIKPIYNLPAETIEGQFGLLKHKLLNDRRRVLTLDTAGEVVMWDLIKCKPVESFGKQHVEDVEKVVNTREAVAPWCSIDLSSGNLTVVLEQYNCFDAEVYGDELDLEEPVDFREDQRISLGRWILRYLFANLIDEELRRDEDYRRKLNDEVEKRQAASGRANAPMSISIPQTDVTGLVSPEGATTPKANGLQLPSLTPGLAINQATPGAATSLSGVPETTAASPMSPVDKRTSFAGRQSADNDYFTSPISPADAPTKPTGTPATPATETAPDATNDKGKDKAAEGAKSPGTPFGKKFRMSFGTKKLGRSASHSTQEKPAVVDEKAEESESSSTHEKEVEDSLYGVIQKIHNEYERRLAESPEKIVETGMTPSLPSETPVLKLPPNTKIFIQEETSGSVANIYEGTVASVGRDIEMIERKAPMWLGHVLLQNQITYKDPSKVSFVLHPLGDLPTVASPDGNNRLNANRMLRIKKILAYVAERIEQPQEPEENALRPEEYLEMYCNEQLLDPLMSLATLRTHVWKGGNDIVLYYKSNGRKELRLAEPQPSGEADADATTTTTTTAQQDGAANISTEGNQATTVPQVA